MYIGYTICFWGWVHDKVVNKILWFSKMRVVLDINFGPLDLVCTLNMLNLKILSTYLFL